MAEESEDSTNQDLLSNTYYFADVEGETGTGATEAVAGDGSINTTDSTAGTSSAGDHLVADADVNSIMVGTAGRNDVFEINAATTASAQQTVGTQTIAAQNQEVFIYGMRTSNTLDLDTVKIDLNASTALTSPDGTSSFTSALSGSGSTKTGTLQVSFDKGTANAADDFTVDFGVSVTNITGGQKVSLTYDSDLDATDGSSTDNVTMDLFFADAGNIDSTTLINRIQWES